MNAAAPGMTGDNYSAFGLRPLPPIRAARAEICVNVLRDTARDLRTDAALKKRVEPAEAEAPEAQAAALDYAAAIIAGEDPEPPRLGVAAGRGPTDHLCDKPGCGASAPFGFGLSNEPGRWACGAHRAEIEDLYRTERAERERKNAEALQPNTSMAGLGGRLV